MTRGFRTAVLLLLAILMTACATSPTIADDPLAIEVERLRADVEEWNRQHATWKDQNARLVQLPVYRALVARGQREAAGLPHDRPMSDDELRWLPLATEHEQAGVRLTAWRDRLEDRRLRLLQMAEARRSRPYESNVTICLATPIGSGLAITGCH